MAAPSICGPTRKAKGRFPSRADSAENGLGGLGMVPPGPAHMKRPRELRLARLSRAIAASRLPGGQHRDRAGSARPATARAARGEPGTGAPPDFLTAVRTRPTPSADEVAHGRIRPLDHRRRPLCQADGTRRPGRDVSSRSSNDACALAGLLQSHGPGAHSNRSQRLQPLPSSQVRGHLQD